MKDIETLPSPGQASETDSLSLVGDVLFFSVRDAATGVELWSIQGDPFAGSLVKDIVEGPASSNPRSITDVSGTAFFVVRDDELWTSDGSDFGTVLVKALEQVDHLTPVGGVLFFTAGDPAGGIELWKSDGTSAGTMMVADVFPGEQGSHPRDLVAVGTTLFFSAESPGFGRELWKSDTLTGETVLVVELAPLEESGNPRNLTPFGDRLLFTATDFQGEELWITDGFGVAMLGDLEQGPDGSSPAEITVAGPIAYFSAWTRDFGRELWTTDGTPGNTRLLGDLRPGSDSSDPRSFSEFENGVVFSADDGVHGHELWRTDSFGSPFLVEDLRPGAESSAPANFTNLAGSLYFTAETSSGRRELWRSDGNIFGSFVVPLGCCTAGGPSPRMLTPFNDFLYARADDIFFDLWATNNFATFPVILPGTVPGSASPSQLVALGNTVVFQAFETATGMELWKSDGTEAGTGIVKDIAPGEQSSFAGGNTFRTGTSVLFSAQDPVQGSELWRSDGTESGTVLVKNINPTSSSFPGSFVEIGGVVLFFANDGVNGRELWRTDGTAGGTVLVKDIAAGPAGVDSMLFGAGDVAFFVATTSPLGREIWKTDGSEAGTVLVRDLGEGQNAFGPTILVAGDGVAYFSFDDLVHGDELWKTDGTEAGTLMVKDIQPGSFGSSPRFAVHFGGRVFFAAHADNTGDELWVTDGTSAGTHLVKDIGVGVASNPYSLTVVGDQLFFVADDGILAPELYVTDGTEDGTRLVADIAAGGDGSFPQAMVNVRDLLVFNALTRDTGGEMWQSDGTEPGTFLVSDIRPGPASSGPGNFTVAGKKVFLTAEDLLTGRELWAADLPNGLPVADAGPDQEVEQGVPVTLDGSASFDPDGDELAFEWRDIDGALLGTAAVVTLPPLDEGLYEVTLTVSDGVDSDSDVVTVNVLGPPSISLVDTVAIEGNQGLHETIVRLELSRAATETVYVAYATLPQSATPLFDFIPKVGVVALAPGEVEAEIPLTLVGDRRCEPNETFRVDLFFPLNAEIADGSAMVTILDDDCLP